MRMGFDETGHCKRGLIDERPCRGSRKPASMGRSRSSSGRASPMGSLLFLNLFSGYSHEGECSGWVTHRLFELAGRIIIGVNAPRRPLQEFIFPPRQWTAAVLSAAVTCIDRLALRASYSGKVLLKFAGLAGLSLPLRGRRVGVGSPTPLAFFRVGFLGHAAFPGLHRLALAPRLCGLADALDAFGDAAS